MSAKIFICGDVVNTLKEQSDFCSPELKKIINSCDYAICNFEGPVESTGSEIPKSGPHILQKKETMRLLKRTGFDLLLLANNHMYDYGEEGLKATLAEAFKNDLDVIGAGLNCTTAYQPLFKEIGGVKVAIINACEAQFGVLDGNDTAQKSGYAWLNHWMIDDAIVSAKRLADVVIVCAHAGLEDCSVPLSEWRKRYKRLCDLGADCIIGSHPHVPQGYEIYNGKPIFYSLGNFYFDTMPFADSPDYSYSVILDISKNNISFNFVYHQNENGVVCLSNTNEYFSMDILNELISDNDYLNKVYIDSYEKICRVYLKSSLNAVSLSGLIKSVVSKLFKHVFFKKIGRKKREILLMHLVRNETYRWVTQRAIEIKYRDD